MAKDKTPTFSVSIPNLLQPMPGKATDRRAWSIPIQAIWLPFFTATNVTGETAIAAEALGAPLRLQRNDDGMPKFSKTGRPVIRVVKELSDQIRIVRENFTAGLLAYAQGVQKAMPNEFKAQAEANHKAGEPIAQKDVSDLEEYLELMKLEAQEAAKTEGQPETAETEAVPVAA